MPEKKYILTINPGSTSTKLAIFEEEENIITESIRHTAEELTPYTRIIEQKDFRTRLVMEFLERNNFGKGDFRALVGRGGILTPMESGTYRVTDEMTDYLSNNSLEHAANLGAVIARSIGEVVDAPSFIVDPVVVDEMDEVAKITGIPEIRRKSLLHALNQKAAARIAAKSLDKGYNDCNFIVAHLGGGTSIGAHKRGRVVDVNNGLNGDGPFSPERAGTIPAWCLVELVNSGKYSLPEVKRLLTGKGGLVAHLQSNDAREVEKMIAGGDEYARQVYTAMAYTVSKEIGSLAPVLEGDIDAIVLTGGVVYNKMFVDMVKQRVRFLAPVILLPGEDEMKSLALGALRVLKGEEEPKTWKNNTN